MRILVTGSSGFIGSNIVPFLRSQGCEVVGVDVRSGEFTDVIVKSLVDVTTRYAESEFNVFVNLAAETDTKYEVDYFRLNYEQVLSVRTEWPNIYFIQASTMLANVEFFNDVDYMTFRYGVSKRLVEERFSRDPNFLSLRFPMVYGIKGMSQYHLKKFNFYSRVFKYFRVGAAREKKSMLNVDRLGGEILNFADAKVVGIRYVCDDVLMSMEELSFFLFGVVPNKARLNIPSLFVSLCAFLSPKIKQLVKNASLRYDFR